MRNIQDVYDKFEKYLQVEKRKDVPSISYFSMEYGLSHVLKIYSGGLGILAGDYLKEASDSNIDMTAVGSYTDTDISLKLCRWTGSKSPTMKPRISINYPSSN